MHRFKRIWLLILCFGFIAFGLIFFEAYNIKRGANQTHRELENLTAFAKLYGYVKYFHPSDEAQEIDWDKFAIHGVRQVMRANSQEELEEILYSLFKPIAPSIRISDEEISPESFIASYLEGLGQDTTVLIPVTWQHLGVDLGEENSVYTSVRTNSPGDKWDKKLILHQILDPEKWKLKTLKLTAIIHQSADSTENELLPFILLNNEDAIYGEKTVEEHPENTQISGGREVYQATVASENLGEDIQQLSIGIQFTGVGSVGIERIDLFVQSDEGEWEQIDINNPAFLDITADQPDGWEMAHTGDFDLDIQDESETSARQFFTITSSLQLFDNYPNQNDVIWKEIVEGMWCTLPLTLFRNHDHTLPKGETEELLKLQQQLKSIYMEFATGDNEGVRLANVIITWNIFQHFYPYFDVVDIDWEEQLSLALRRALQDNTAEDFYLTLNQMLASLQDGHIRLRHPSAQNRLGLPFLVDWVENQVVVTHSINEDFLAGDTVVMVDGIQSGAIIDSTKHLISGSPQLSRFRALRQFGSGEPQSEANITLRRGSDEFEVTALRSWYSPIRNMDRNHLPVIEEIEEGIYFVDLDRASLNQIKVHLEQIATAKGVIFDLRGYPKRNHDILRHLLNEPDIPNSRMQIPMVIYPDQKEIKYETRKWYLQPASPQIEGNVVFITDARAISYAETFLSFVEHYKLGEIVGQPTAGANGNVNFVNLPGDYSFAWTGMKVLKHDGSQHHLIGVRPTVAVEKTIKGIRQGRDEFLEKAIEIVQSPEIFHQK